MADPIFLHPEAVEWIHDWIVADFGGLVGFPHPDLLESAVGATRHRYHYEPGCDLFDLAATYLWHIASNHSFNDGNKRTAYVSAIAFLGMNDIIVEMPPSGPLRNALERVTLLVAGGRRHKGDVAALLRQMAAASPGAKTPRVYMKKRP